MNIKSLQQGSKIWMNDRPGDNADMMVIDDHRLLLFFNGTIGQGRYAKNYDQIRDEWKDPYNSSHICSYFPTTNAYELCADKSKMSFLHPLVRNALVEQEYFCIAPPGFVRTFHGGEKVKAWLKVPSIADVSRNLEDLRDKRIIAAASEGSFDQELFNTYMLSNIGNIVTRTPVSKWNIVEKYRYNERGWTSVMGARIWGWTAIAEYDNSAIEVTNAPERKEGLNWMGARYKVIRKAFVYFSSNEYERLFGGETA